MTRCVLIILVYVFIAAGKAFAVLPTPFPLCTGDMDTRGFHTQMDAGYSFVRMSVADMGYAGFGVKGVFAGNRAGRPSLHMAVYGAAVTGDRDEVDSDYVKGYDIEGQFAGISLTPSFVMSDSSAWMTPVFFIGGHAQVQSVKYRMTLADTSININLDGWTKPVYNPFTGWDLHPEIEQETVAAGVHTGVQLAMQFDALSLNPFLMVHYSREKIDWEDDPYEIQVDETGNYIMNSIGIHILMARPKLSLTAIAQFARDEDGDDAQVYTLLTGFSF